MVKTSTPPPTADRVGAGEAVPALLRRATADDAFAVARALFLNSERVDMGALAERLSVSRATVYRWVGSREQLHERIAGERADEFGEWARAEARGRGLARVIHAIGLIAQTTVSVEPMRAFIEREPQLALQILASREGAVQRSIVKTLCEVASDGGVRADAKTRARIEAAVEVASALQWVMIAGRQEVSSERIVELASAQLAPR